MMLTPKEKQLLKSSVLFSINSVKEKLAKFENVTDKTCYAFEQKQELNNTLRRYNNILGKFIANEISELNEER